MSVVESSDTPPSSPSCVSVPAEEERREAFARIEDRLEGACKKDNVRRPR